MQPKEIGARRREGNFWNAYYARFVEDNVRRRLMQTAMADIIEEITGRRPIWPDRPQPAPNGD